MATSGSYNFALTRDDIITLAHQHVGLVGEGETCTSAQLSEGANLLNMIAKLRATDGMPLWTRKRGIILPFSDTSSINTNSHVVSTYETTTIAADVSSGTSITVDTAVGANGDQIGVEQDDGTMLWTTISSGGGTTSITLATAVTDTVADGNRIYVYTASTDRIPARPLRVLDANMLQSSDSKSWSLDILSNQDYYSLGNRTSAGVPNSIYYDEILGAETADPTSSSNWYGTFYIYPQFTNGDYVIEFTYQRPIQDFDSATDSVDFPQEFYLPLMLELASLLGPKAGVTIEERRALFLEAKTYLDEALSNMSSETSLFLQPDLMRA